MKDIFISTFLKNNKFNKTPHTDTVENTYNKSPIAHTPVDYDNNDGISDYAESRVSLQATTPFLHNKDVGTYGLDAIQDGEKTGERISQGNQVTLATALKLTVKGQSYLQPGNLIRFHLRDINADIDKDNPVDPRFSGNYIITKIRHIVHLEEYRMILECAKDSVATSYGEVHQGVRLHRDGIHKASKSKLEIEEIDSDIGY